MRSKFRLGFFALVAGATLALGAVACSETAATVTTSSQSPTATPGQLPTSSPTQAPSGTPPAPGDGGPTAATIQNFNLPNLQLTAGTTVTWTNQDSDPHTVTHGTPSAQGDAFGSSSLDQGGAFSFTFDEPGRYDYFCAIHPSMTGVIVVSGDAASTSTPPPTAVATATLVPVLASPTSTPAVATPTPPPATATPADPTATPNGGGEQYSAEIASFAHEVFTIQAGTEVTWTNLDNALHTVSSGTPESPSSAFNSPGMTQNQTYTFTFDEPGEYPYFCSPHPFMRGRVIVE